MLAKFVFRLINKPDLEIDHLEVESVPCVGDRVALPTDDTIVFAEVAAVQWILDPKIRPVNRKLHVIVFLSEV